MDSVLFINHSGEKCGVYQYGLNVYQAVNKLHLEYAECSNLEELEACLKQKDWELVIYNYYEATLPFVTPSLLKKFPRIVHISLTHELTEEVANQIDGSFFDFYIFADPTLKFENPRVFKIGRLIPDYNNTQKEPEIPTIGSYGFANQIKQFEEIVDLVQQEFDEAIIRINIAFNDRVDDEGIEAKACAEKCRKRIRKKNISLEITHYFFSKQELLEFLSKNSINVLLYNEFGLPGISSAADQMLAVKRPLAVSDCCFFRHLFSLEPSIILKSKSISQFFLRSWGFFKALLRRKRRKILQTYLPSLSCLFWFYFSSKRKLKYSSLKQILANGTTPLEDLYALWNSSQFYNEFENILNRIRHLNSLHLNHIQED